MFALDGMIDRPHPEWDEEECVHWVEGEDGGGEKTKTKQSPRLVIIDVF